MLWAKGIEMMSVLFRDALCPMCGGKKMCALSGNRTHVSSATTRYPNHWMMGAENIQKHYGIENAVKSFLKVSLSCFQQKYTFKAQFRDTDWQKSRLDDETQKHLENSIWLKTVMIVVLDDESRKCKKTPCDTNMIQTHKHSTAKVSLFFIQQIQYHTELRKPLRMEADNRWQNFMR